MKAQRLSELNIQTVGLVPAGADQDAHIVLAKRAPNIEEDSMANSEKIAGVLKELDAETRAALVAALQEEVTTEEEAVTEPVVATADEVTKADDATTVSTESETKTEEPAVTTEDAVEPAATAEETTVTAPEAVAKSEETTVSKAEFTEVQKQLKEAREAIAKAQEEREIRDERDAVAKSFPDLGDDADKFAEAKYRMAKGSATAEDATFVVDLVAKLYRAVKESALFEEFGSSQEGDASPEATIEKEADRLMAEDASLTRPQAISKAVSTPVGRRAYRDLV